MVALTNQESSVSTSSREESAHGDYKRTEQSKGETLHWLKSTNPDMGKMKVFTCLKSLYGVESLQFRLNSESYCSLLNDIVWRLSPELVHTIEKYHGYLNF